MRKLVLGLAALLSVAVVAALFVLLRAEPREVDARPVTPNGDAIAVQARGEVDAALDAHATDSGAERAEVHAPISGAKAGTSAAADPARPGDKTPALDSFIAGDVVDEAGHGLAGVEVTAQRFWKDGQAGVLTDTGFVGEVPGSRSSTTDATGHFRIAASSAAHLLLSAQAVGFDDYYDSWRGDGRAPGTSDNHLVLHALPRARFRVVDANSQQPIERFDMRLSSMRESSLPGGARQLHEGTHMVAATIYPGGICELFERAELPSFFIVDGSEGAFQRDQVALAMRGYQIESPGYAPQCGWIAPAAHTADGQTIRLERGGSISARVLLDGKPAAYAVTSLRSAKPDEALSDPQLADASAFLGRLRRSNSTNDGALSFVDLATGTYQLEVSLRGKAKLAIERIDVVQGAETALGDLRMVSNPNVRCTLLVPGGRVPAYYNVTAKCADEKSDGRVDSQGVFSISSLPAGHWTFEAPAEPSFFCDGPPLEFDVAADQRELTLDLRERVGGWLTLIVRVNGVPTPGVTLLARSGGRVVAEDRHTAGQGISVLWIDATNPIDVFFTTAKGMPLGRAGEAISVPRGGEVEVTCDLQAGELVVDLASLTELQADAPVTLQLESDREPRMLASLSLAARPEPTFNRETGEFVRTKHATPPRSDLGLVATGTYRAHLRASLRNAQDDSVIPIDYMRDVAIRAGEVNEVRFTDGDRVK